VDGAPTDDASPSTPASVARTWTEPASVARTEPAYQGSGGDDPVTPPSRPAAACSRTSESRVRSAGQTSPSFAGGSSAPLGVSGRGDARSCSVRSRSRGACSGASSDPEMRAFVSRCRDQGVAPSSPSLLCPGSEDTSPAESPGSASAAEERGQDVWLRQLPGPVGDLLRREGCASDQAMLERFPEAQDLLDWLDSRGVPTPSDQSVHAVWTFGKRREKLRASERRACTPSPRISSAREPPPRVFLDGRRAREFQISLEDRRRPGEALAIAATPRAGLKLKVTKESCIQALRAAFLELGDLGALWMEGAPAEKQADLVIKPFLKPEFEQLSPHCSSLWRWRRWFAKQDSDERCLAPSPYLFWYLARFSLRRWPYSRGRRRGAHAMVERARGYALPGGA
jgi:hypothetical protein